VFWFWLGLATMLSVPTVVAVFMTGLHVWLRWRFLNIIERIFLERPFFIIPRGQPVANAEDVRVPTRDGLTLSGCYLKGDGPRRGVILFGLEFGSNRWACVSYCERLLKNGYDVFAFESRSTGDSDKMPGYEPLPWVSNHEVADMEAALAYLKSRPDADPRGVGFFGISKGAGASLIAASQNPEIRCCVTDGVFATLTTALPYMQMWVRIYNNWYVLHALAPLWYYNLMAIVALRRIARRWRCRFVSLERAMPKLRGRPLLMIHGEGDTYIKPDMAKSLFQRAPGPKELWLVPGAKHNQAFHVAGEEYHRRILDFFDKHLARECGARAGEHGMKESPSTPSSAPRAPHSETPNPPTVDVQANREVPA
jgi:pimeloyl-ACP methyl ester carboxylesterase